MYLLKIKTTLGLNIPYSEILLYTLGLYFVMKKKDYLHYYLLSFI